jgi:hypothetical protein
MHLVEAFTRVLGDSHNRKLKELACASSDGPLTAYPPPFRRECAKAPTSSVLLGILGGLGGVPRHTRSAASQIDGLGRNIFTSGH